MMDIIFEETPWEKTLSALCPGESITALRFLSLTEELSEEELEEALLALEEKGIALDISDLPKMADDSAAAVRLRREQQLVKSGDLLTGLEETDPLRLYLEELAGIPVCGDIRILAKDLGNANRAGKANDRLCDALVNLSLSAVVTLAGAHTGKGVLLMDLIQEGSIGLWKCTQSWIGRGEDFEGIRDWWIRFYMAKEVLLQARASGVGQKMRSALEDYRAVDERLLGELGRNATLEEIAMEMHISPEEAAVVKKTLDNARLVASARKPEQEEEEEQEEDSQAVEDTAYFRMRQRIADLLSGLSEQDQKLLTLRFGLEGGKPLSPEETGRHLGLTPDEVVAREGTALAKLRNG
jgi:RNA polymerase primary sigma factor